MWPKHRRHKRKRWVERHPGATRLPQQVAPQPPAAPSEITVMAYGPQDILERRLGSAAELRKYQNQHAVLWLNVDGLADVKLVQQIGEIFGLHPLALEDVVHVHQRAKVEEYDTVLFITARMMQVVNEHLESEQISFFLGKNFVVSFQERPGKDAIDSVRARLRRGSARLRSGGPDVLLYHLLDAVLDSYFPVLEHYGERLEQLEEEASLRPAARLIERIHALKTDLVAVRRAIWPHRDMVNVLVRDENPLVRPETRLFLRDCYDHTVQLIDLVETYRELALDVRDLFLSGVSHRLNEVIKVLTIISTIFLPLTFIAGVYGMNFNTHVSPWNMPELNWRYGYLFAFGLMGAVALGLVGYFRHKGWIGGRDLHPPGRRADDHGNGNGHDIGNGPTSGHGHGVAP